MASSAITTPSCTTPRATKIAARQPAFTRAAFSQPRSLILALQTPPQAWVVAAIETLRASGPKIISTINNTATLPATRVSA
ncbi:hypothetical protein GCM10010909_32010 [Acidocella aquatica]|uniref:Uncharacterized protein n=1 Tax=Acidocella aquatica TaxID=1922313 RepID=A0ABQ6AAT2_9PROT|nr:hypothetical protein GCM10010909_32010 [Acidocella aquatica]